MSLRPRLSLQLDFIYLRKGKPKLNCLLFTLILLTLFRHFVRTTNEAIEVKDLSLCSWHLRSNQAVRDSCSFETENRPNCHVQANRTAEPPRLWSLQQRL